MLANLLREGSSVNHIAPFRWNVGLCVSLARVRWVAHGFTTNMSLPGEHNDVSIHVIIIIFEATNRRTLGDLSDGINDGLGKIHSKP